jgi:hypothetical protein
MVDTGKCIYFNKSWYSNKKRFLKHFGVKQKSYIGLVMSRLHAFFFANACYLRKDFRRYYRREFCSLKEYLDKKHNLFEQEIVNLNPRIAQISMKQYAEWYNVETLVDYDTDGIISREVNEIFGFSDSAQSKGEHYDN